MEMNMKEAEIEYQEKLSKFKKYRKNGVDLAFRCNECGKIVLQSDVLFGVGCRKCGGARVRPITINLTKFGVQWCRLWNWFWGKYYEFKKF